MKKSELRNIIKEEIRNILTEKKLKSFKVPSTFRHEDTSIPRGEYRFIREKFGSLQYQHNYDTPVPLRQNDIDKYIKTKKIIPS